jgi:hypothetical protein
MVFTKLKWHLVTKPVSVSHKLPEYFHCPKSLEEEMSVRMVKRALVKNSFRRFEDETEIIQQYLCFRELRAIAIDNDIFTLLITIFKAVMYIGTDAYRSILMVQGRWQRLQKISGLRERERWREKEPLFSNK